MTLFRAEVHPKGADHKRVPLNFRTPKAKAVSRALSLLVLTCCRASVNLMDMITDFCCVTTVPGVCLCIVVH